MFRLLVFGSEIIPTFGFGARPKNGRWLLLWVLGGSPDWGVAGKARISVQAVGGHPPFSLDPVLDREREWDLTD